MRAAAGQGSAGAVPKPGPAVAGGLSHSHREKLEVRFAFLRVSFQLPKTFAFTYLDIKKKATRAANPKAANPKSAANSDEPDKRKRGGKIKISATMFQPADDNPD
ncbi:hypothetical protein CCUS01_01690 [Colletotrichum cuscutae]|uniref:Uncharacterized protein n=1 Tax=Colletotrichum cuscutae TaxID=1209917 RepID=A0AAI9UF29_9PEZI|nr:hypothetical protein CCUS01_01690 [Colletotrichum cuscutae]